MNKFTRIWNVMAGIFTILISLVMWAVPDMGYVLAIWILGVILVLNGIKQLLYYVSMGTHMVGGKLILFRALITIDIGSFTISIHENGQRYVLFYFAIYYFLAGLISIFRAFESYRLEADSWKMKLISGLVDTILGGICLMNNNSVGTMLDVLCFALIVSAVTRICTVLRKNAIVYIQ